MNMVPIDLTTRDSDGTTIIDNLEALRCYAINLTRSKSWADDLVQITFEKAVGFLPRFRPGTRYKAWMVQVLRNEYFDQIRRENIRRNRGEAFYELHGPRDELAATIAHRDLMARLRIGISILMELPPHQRHPYVLMYYGGYSQQETAEILGLKLGTLKSRLCRAQDFLKTRSSPTRTIEKSDAELGAWLNAEATTAADTPPLLVAYRRLKAALTVCEPPHQC